ncbi:MAG TPA: hypothetical protein VKO84_08420 [Gaiellaceae bacterium]|nr:hypothetical protein [Gaiellaceae bacterium]
MPSGKKTRQQRRAEARRKPPAVRSKDGAPAPRFSTRTLVIGGAVLAVAIGLGVGLPLALSRSGGSASPPGHLGPAFKGGKASPPNGKTGFEGIPLESGPEIAPAGGPSPGGSVDGIACAPSEQLLFHIHARLTIFVNGKSRAVPAGVGFGSPVVEQTPKGPVVGSGTCVAWLHTHTTDGIIHIESPVQRTFTLGNFFDVWGESLSKTQVGPVTGNVTAIVDGRTWVGDPRTIPLTEHAQIQLEVGTPLVAPVRNTSWAGL